MRPTCYRGTACFLIFFLFACTDPDSGPSDESDNTCTVDRPKERRPSAPFCDPDRAESEFLPPDNSFTCREDSDCIDGLNGRCSSITDGGEHAYKCTYDECLEDRDCGNGVCACDAGEIATNICLAGNCATDADCAETGFCSPSRTCLLSPPVGFFCHTCDDQCINDSDCTESGEKCAFNPNEMIWTCQPIQCP